MIIKGIGLYFIMNTCFGLTANSGNCFNPAQALAQTSYYLAYFNHKDAKVEHVANFLWVYMIFPFVGAVLAAYFARFHKRVDKSQ